MMIFKILKLFSVTQRRSIGRRRPGRRPVGRDASPGGSRRLLEDPGGSWRFPEAPGGSWRLLEAPGGSCSFLDGHGSHLCTGSQSSWTAKTV